MALIILKTGKTPSALRQLLEKPYAGHPSATRDCAPAPWAGYAPPIQPVGRSAAGVAMVFHFNLWSHLTVGGNGSVQSTSEMNATTP